MDDEKWGDVIDRLARIEVKIDGYETIKTELNSTKADAQKALAIANENKHDIAEIKSNNKWAWGYMIGLGISIVVYFLTKL